MLENLIVSTLLANETIGILLVGSTIWLYLKWRKSIRLKETFIGIQFIED